MGHVARAVAAEFQFIDALPGRKILLKGNHDYWWGTASKMKKFFAEHDITTLDILYNNAFFYGDHAICGTRGWFYRRGRRWHAHGQDARARGAAA